MHIRAGSIHVRTHKCRLKLVVSSSRGCKSVDAIQAVRARMKTSLMRRDIWRSSVNRGGAVTPVVKVSRHAILNIVSPLDYAGGAARSVRVEDQAATKHSGISITPHTVGI